MSNPYGIHPVEYKVLVLLDPVEEKTRGGILLAAETKERRQFAETFARLVDVGGLAFSDWQGRRPEVGERVLIAKYAGQAPRPGDDDVNRLRIINDKDICAVLDDSVSAGLALAAVQVAA